MGGGGGGGGETTAGWGWNWPAQQPQPQQSAGGWSWPQQQQQQQAATAAGDDQLTIDYNHGAQQRRPVRHVTGRDLTRPSRRCPVFGSCFHLAVLKNKNNTVLQELDLKLLP